MPSNQPLAFGALLAGGLLITSALTGDSLAAVLSGKATHLSRPNGTGGSTKVGTGMVAAVNGKTGLTNPLAAAHGLTPERIDMGKDFSMAPGSPILALGNSKVVGINPSWYQGQPYVWFQLLNESGGTSPTAQSPYAGKYWYVAEQIVPSVRPGQIVAAGQQVATYAQSGTGIEMGFAAQSGETLAQATTGYTEGEVTVAGQEFDKLLAALGVPV